MFGLSWYRHSRAIAFRKELKQMENRIISRGNELFVGSGVGEWRGQPKYQWTHANGFLMLGALNSVGDFEKHRGGEWSGMFFDEATDMLPENVQSMLGWNRSTRGEYCQAFMYFNPPQDVAGEWVINYFSPWIDNDYSDPHNLGVAGEGDIRWFITHEGMSTETKNGNPVEIGNQTFTPEPRTFFKSRLEENPDLGDDYKNRLASLPYPLNEQLLKGDFNVGREPGAFQVIPTQWFNAAVRRWEVTEQPTTQIDQIGMDVARAGKAQTVLSKRRGLYFDKLIKVPGAFTPDGQAAAKMIQDNRQVNTRINVDVVGVGSAVYDVLRERGVRSHAINVANTTEAKNRTGHLEFANIRSEMWWKFREALEPGYGLELAIPRDDQLRVEMCTPRFRLTSGGKIQIEGKDDVIDRIGRSTDCADALLLAFWREGRTLSTNTLRLSSMSAR